MKPHLQRNARVSLLLFVLILAAFTPGTVFAEGDIPEDPLPEPILEPAPEPLQETAGAVEALAENGAVIVEESGEFVPLASQKALAGLGDPDPWFYCSACAGGKATYLGVNSLATALSDWGAKKGYGFIYLEGGYLHNAFLPIDGSIPGRNTLKGIVWDKTTPGAKPRLDALTYIYSFNNGFILQGVSMTANFTSSALQVFSNKGTIRLTDVDIMNTGGGGLEVYNQGSIILNGVSAAQNKYHGANLINTYFDSVLGKYINKGTITVTNSEFLMNGGPADGTNFTGLSILSAGNILLNGVAANGNYGNGALVSAFGPSAVIKNSSFSNNTAVPDSILFGHGIRFDPGSLANITLDNITLINNENNGAALATSGNIVLKKVTAGFNGKNGVRISSDLTVEALGARNVTVQDSNFYRNVNTGLLMYVSGAVKVTNLTSTNSSIGGGLYIDNHTFAINDVPVTIMGAVVNNNFGGGLSVNSSGNITLAGITALYNGFSSISNHNTNATGSVTISGALGLNRFNGNDSGNGLSIASARNVNISSLQANGNIYSGMNILGGGPASNVTLVNVEVSGNAGLFSSPGLYIRATGNVVLDRLAVSENVREGIFIENDIALTPKLVKISNSAASDNGREGIVVISVGAITLVNVTASGNLGDGAALTNQVTTFTPQGITVQKSTFDGNSYNGLKVQSQRAVTLVSVNASYNNFSGVYVINTFAGSTSPIVMTGTNRFIGNSFGGSSAGVTLSTNGTLTLRGITVAFSGGNGITAYSGALQNTLSNIVVQGNYNGIFLATTGKTLLNGVTAFQNLNNGILIFASATKVAIASSMVVGNGGYGMEIDVTTPATDLYVAPSTVVLGNAFGNYIVY